VTAFELLAVLRNEGARVWLERGHLKLRAPRGVVSDKRRAMLADLRVEIVALLTTHPCADCGRFAFRRAGVVCFHCRRGA
jgi:hypothetical protein